MVTKIFDFHSKFESGGGPPLNPNEQPQGAGRGDARRFAVE
jgi:hypothetical protein